MRNKPLQRQEIGIDGGVCGSGAVAREQSLVLLADSQHGYVTSAQLDALGIDRYAVRRRVKSGRLHPKHRGVFLVGRPDSPRLGDEHAAALACGAGALLSHRSMAWALRLPVPRPPEVDVTVPRVRAPTHAGIRVHRAIDLPPAHITTIDGIPATSALCTLLDLAGLAAKSTRQVPAETLEAALAEALHRHLVRPSELRTAVAERSSRPGAPLLRRLVGPSSGPALTKSEAERRLLRLIRAAQLDQPEANVLLGRYEVDLVWREQRLIVEIDGFEFHGSRRSFEADRARDAALQAAGWRVMRVTWRQITQTAAAVVARLAAALAVR
jgi:very-short-patch-repair endonuclease